MKEYVCYTNKGKWTFTAEDDIDAMRVALYYCYMYGPVLLLHVWGGIYQNRVWAIYIQAQDSSNLPN